VRFCDIFGGKLAPRASAQVSPMRNTPLVGPSPILYQLDPLEENESSAGLIIILLQ